MGPTRPAQLARQDVANVDLDNDLSVEVVSGIEIEVSMGMSGKAVDAPLLQ